MRFGVESPSRASKRIGRDRTFVADFRKRFESRSLTALGEVRFDSFDQLRNRFLGLRPELRERFGGRDPIYPTKSVEFGDEQPDLFGFLGGRVRRSRCGKLNRSHREHQK